MNNHLISPPPIVTRYEYPIYEKETQASGQREYMTPTGGLPSVTTILSATKDMSGLDKWRAFVGDAKADEIIRIAVTAGNLMHESVENFIERQPRKNGSNHIHKLARSMADRIINEGLCNVDEVWGVEIPLYFPHAYAGTTDLVGVYNGKPAIMDHKNSKKIKKRSWIEDYFIQGALYAEAHNELYGTDIRQIVIFMASRDHEYKTFVVEGDKYDEYAVKGFERVVEYYKLQESA